MCDVTVAKNHNLFVKGKISDSAILAHNCLDENLKGLDAFLGEYYYSLGNLSVQYGFTGYLNAEFGKQHRANFGEADLSDKAVVRYTTNDVVVPFAIHNVQKQRARDRRYTHYDGVVRWEISDTIHAFSKMEHTGAGLDVNYLNLS